MCGGRKGLMSLRGDGDGNGEESVGGVCVCSKGGLVEVLELWS